MIAPVSARLRAAAAAVLLLLTGAIGGVIVDRTILAPRESHAGPLTADAMVRRLGLSATDEARLRSLLDSLHEDLGAAAGGGPDQLRMAARHAHERIEAALPPEARAEFRAWMAEHHDHMMHRMHGPGGHAPMSHEGRMGRQAR